MSHAKMPNPPSQTIYVNHLNEKVPKQELRRSLYALYSQFGPILDVVALKTIKMRGQAFVVFRDIADASNALRGTQGYVFYGKPMAVAYAKEKSNVLTKGQPVKKKVVKKARVTTDTAAVTAGDEEDEDIAMDVEEDNAVATPGPGGDDITATQEGEHNILFVSNLPDECTEAMLVALFQQFPGYRESRTVGGRADIAFVEFDSAPKATVALEALQGFKVSPKHAMVIKYAKK
eukprot:m.7236 g.7236  ORF g.7236 m.7236 type:complete len:233 (-) comp2868_c0_seq2:264-962(-)